MRCINILAPKWSGLFDRIVKENLNEYDTYSIMHYLGLDIGKLHLCIVGEAHEWTSAYGTERYEDFFCRKCADFSSNLSGFSFIQFFTRLIEEKKAKFRVNWRNDPFIKDFEQHMIKHENEKWDDE